MRAAWVGVSVALLATGCVMPASPGFGGYGAVILLPNGSVGLPREDSLQACAQSVRAGAAAPDPLTLGPFQSLLPGAGRKPAGALGVCTGPDGIANLVTATEILPGARLVIAP